MPDATKSHPLVAKVIPYFAVSKDIQNENDVAECNESHCTQYHRLFCRQKRKSGGCNEMSSPPLLSVSLPKKLLVS